MATMDPTLKSSGINFDPLTLSDTISTAHLEFRARGLFRGAEVELISPLDG